MLHQFQPYDQNLWLWGRSYAARAGRLAGSFEAVRTDRYFVEPAAVLTLGRLEIDGKPVEDRIFELEKGTHSVRYVGPAGSFFILWLPRNGETYRPSPGSGSRFSQIFAQPPPRH